MSCVIEINDIEQLDAYRLTWKSLLLKTRGASFFHSLEWLEVYWRHFGEGQKLRVLIIQSDGETIGIVPLTVRTEKSKVGSLRTLTYPLADWGTFFGPLGPDVRGTLQVAMQYIRRTTRDWDVIALRWVNNDHRDHRRTEMSMKAAGFQAHRVAMKGVGMIDLREGWDTYWSSRTSKWRNNVRRNERRANECGKISFVRHRPEGSAFGDDDPRWDLYDAIVEIAASSWQHNSTNGTTVSSEEIRAYLRDAHQVAAKAGALDMSLLLVDDQPIAFTYNYHYAGCVQGLRMGTDAERAFEGAGTVLMRHMLEDGAERGDQIYDTGAGSLECKMRWLSHIETQYRYMHYPVAVLRTQVIRAKRWLGQRTAASA
jgi:CelD/BcsL family acetyltransferase involved in cellulose biosynthesis